MSRLGDMWGDQAVQASAALVCCSKAPVEGVERTMFGGVLLDKMVYHDGWERWSGTMIFVPTRIDITKEPCFLNLQQMLTDRLSSSELWKPRWMMP